MPDYKEMYLIMMRAATKAIDVLIEAQQQCEELYLEEKEPILLPRRPAEEEGEMGRPS